MIFAGVYGDDDKEKERIGGVSECGSYLDSPGMGAFDVLGRDEHYCISDCSDYYSCGTGILKRL